MLYINKLKIDRKQILYNYICFVFLLLQKNYAVSDGTN